MCMVYYVGDYWKDNFPKKHPEIYWPILPQVQPNPLPDVKKKDEEYKEKIKVKSKELISREEFDEIKKEMQELKKLLIAAKEYDEKNGEPNCEMDEKIELVKKIADLVGVDMKDVFK